MIQFENVFLGFGGYSLFKNASIALQKGEKCGLVGRNGSGKSTIFKLVNKEFEADSGIIKVAKNYRLGILQQHIRFTKPTLIQEAVLGLSEEDQDNVYKAEKILFGLGFTEDDLEKPPHIFSGGYHLRLHLAKTLLSEPDCLLLDEPTNYLDLLSIRWLTNFLKRWNGEFILISHDRDFMDSVTTHTMGIHRETFRKIKGSSIDFYNNILEEERVYERTRSKQEKRREHLESFVERFGAKASKAGQAGARKKMLERDPVLEELQEISQLGFSFNEAPFAGKKMLETKELSFSYTDEPLIGGFSLEIEKGDRVAIIGKNGRGKSTLLRLIINDLKPKMGTVEISSNLSAGYFGQTHVDRLNVGHTIEEELASANSSLTSAEVRSIAGRMMFSSDLAKKQLSVLSGGERSRVLLGKIIAKPCNLLLLDEPTHHLDIESIEALIDALENFSGSVVIVTHSELILRRLEVNKIIVCEDAKQTVFLGNYDELLEKNGLHEEEKPAPPKKKESNSRHERALWVTQRSATLKPIEKKIQECEKKIIALEELQKADHTMLENGSISSELMKAIGLRKKDIDLFEKELYALYDEFELKKKEFETPSNN
jgi:ATP-binding cassette, subfamily F, member 3